MTPKLKNTIILLLILPFLITSCTTKEIVEEPVEKQVTLDINLGFTANIDPEYNASMTTPRPSVYGHTENETIIIKAHNNKKYKFSHWIIEAGEEKYEVQEKNHTLNLTMNYTATSYFGCTTTKACNKLSVCQENKCELITELEQQPELMITTPNKSSQYEEQLATRIQQRLNENKFAYYNIMNTFEETNTTELHNKTTIAIFDKEIAIITGINTREPQKVLANIIDEILIRQKIPEDRIKHIKSNQVKTDLYDIFL